MRIIEIIDELLPLSHPLSVNRVEKDDTEQEVHIHLQVDKSYSPGEEYIIHQYYDRTWEHLDIFQYKCFIHCRVPIYKNKTSGKTKALDMGFSRENSRFTLLYEQHILDLLQLYHNFTKVAEQLKIYPQRVADIYHYYTSKLFDDHTVTACERIGIDETSTRKGHNYITAFVDLDTSKIVDIHDGKGADAIGHFFQSHPNPQIVKEISVDMSPAFGNGINQFFSWANVTYDKWHVFKLLGKHLDNLAKKFKTKYAYIVILHEHLRDFYQLKNLDQAKAKLCFIIDFAQEVFGKNSFSKSIRRHFNGIVEYIRSRITNGILEGINSKIQTIKRVAKGFRYIDNFKKMILFVFGIIQPNVKPRKII